MKLLILLLVTIWSTVLSFHNCFHNRVSPVTNTVTTTKETMRSITTNRLLKNRNTKLLNRNQLSMAFDIPLIPAIIGAGVVVFGIFNIENPVDITDAGRAKARAQRRAERLARGELPKSKEGNFLNL